MNYVVIVEAGIPWRNKKTMLTRSIKHQDDKKMEASGATEHSKDVMGSAIGCTQERLQNYTIYKNVK